MNIANSRMMTKRGFLFVCAWFSLFFSFLVQLIYQGGDKIFSQNLKTQEKSEDPWKGRKWCYKQKTVTNTVRINATLIIFLNINGLITNYRQRLKGQSKKTEPNYVLPIRRWLYFSTALGGDGDQTHSSAATASQHEVPRSPL